MFVQAVKFPGIHTWNEKARDNPIAELYHAQSLPTWYLIGPDGRIREKDPFDDRLIPAVERALATSGPPTGTRGE